MTPRTAAASATVRACGPTVSCECEMGMTPARLTRPTVGLIPTTPFAVAGQTIEPSVSVPMDTAGGVAGGPGPGPGPEAQGVGAGAGGGLRWERRPGPTPPTR